jgi:hypothetical protein
VPEHPARRRLRARLGGYDCTVRAVLPRSRIVRGSHDGRLLGQLPPPELVATLFFGVAILLLLVSR